MTVPLWYARTVQDILRQLHTTPQVLCAALWRMPDRDTLASLIAGGWLVAMTLV